MAEGLTSFTKLCRNCGMSKHISLFKLNNRMTHNCYDCRQKIYLRCDICGRPKRKVEMSYEEGVPQGCKECEDQKSEIKNKKFNEAFGILDKVTEST